MTTTPSLSPAPAWAAPYVRALRDYLAGESAAAPLVRVLVPGQLGPAAPLPMASLARGPGAFHPIEEEALRAARGRVLDAGAGLGAAALALQARGLPVVALDVVPDFVEAMRERGVRDARLGDARSFAGERFDTVLMLMNGVGIVEDLAGLRAFLRHARTLLAPDGQLLLDSEDHPVLFGISPYPGELSCRFEYRGEEGAPFRWLAIDLRTLSALADEAGWDVHEAARAPDGRYLARLTPRGGA